MVTQAWHHVIDTAMCEGIVGRRDDRYVYGVQPYKSDLFLAVLSGQENCRLAEPGEFTKIAFQNNKIDLVEAESIGDLIHSETELQRQQAIKLVQGNASNYYNDLRNI